MNENANTLGIFTEQIPRMACPHCDAELDVSEFDVFEDIECPSCKEILKVPGRLHDFILIDELGRGAMGCVYLAQDESLNRLVALKVIRREFGADPKMLETVQREAQAMATLNHRNIVQVYSFGRAEEQPYFVMELLRGERLDEMMADGETVNEVRILEIAYDVAMGLEAAERAGLTHGDIKPANILMNEEGVAKVVDFGLAKFMDPNSEIEVWGTPYYIAPEKARKKGEDSRSDQFSLGGTLFHALAGHPPFDGANPTKVVIASLKEDTPVLLDHNPNVTEKTSAVIRRMMDKNPNRRYPTYASLLADLEEAMRAAVQAEEARKAAERAAEEKASRGIPSMVWIILGTVLMLGLVGGIFAFQQNRNRKLAESVEYEGPARQLHQEQLVRAEVRNIEQAVAAIRNGELKDAEDRLSVAVRHIPEEHSAMAWFNFLTAGIYFYAQDTDEAQRRLEAAANQYPIVFDGGRTPLEDPRTLAGFALGRVDPGELQKDLRKAQPYYRHLAQLAQGYRILLEQGYHPEASRSFKVYSELRMAGVEWPYVLARIAPDLHLPRDPIEEGDFLEGTEKKPTPTPRDRRPTEPRPTPTPRAQEVKSVLDFRVSNLDNRGQRESGTATSPSQTNVLNGKGVWLSNDQVITDAGGLGFRKGSDFVLSLILTLPPSLSGNENAPLIALGTAPRGNTPVGVNVELVASGNAYQLRVHAGDGQKEILDQKVRVAGLTPGSAHLISVAWVSADRRLILSVDGKEAEKFSMGDMPEISGQNLAVAFGRWIGENGVFPASKTEMTLYRRFVLDHVPPMNEVFQQYEGRIRNWSE